MSERFVYPVASYGFYPSDYSHIINWIGKPLLEASDDDCQGDTFAVVEKDGQFGYLQFGWGSCSGCDALQACDTQEEVADLAEHMRSSVVWRTKTELRDWFISHDWAGDFSSGRTRDQFVIDAIKLLSQE